MGAGSYFQLVNNYQSRSPVTVIDQSSEDIKKINDTQELKGL